MTNEIPIKKWRIADPIPDDVAQKFPDYSPVLRQLLFNRGITNPEDSQAYLFGQELFKQQEYDPFLLKDMDLAVARILKAIGTGESIAVYGDYDVDGVSATALLVQILAALSARVVPYIPNRFDEGYGLNNDAIDTLAAQGIQLIVTVDCGIRSVREADYAREKGIDLVISDHHHPRDVIPSAVAVICQKQPGDAYPNKDLSGVGLAFKIAQALVKETGTLDVAAEEYLDYVALGTVADIVPLLGENRSLVRSGLRVLRMGVHPGPTSLAGASGLMVSTLNATDIGFGLGPRLNAAGRLESAEAALKLLVAKDIFEAGLLAQQLDDNNKDRQQKTRDMQQIAEGRVQAEDAILFIVDPEFSHGMVGLVASRLVDHFYRPAIVGQKMEEYTRASCRSIPEFHITHALDECVDLLERHGGHALAAGFTVRNDNLEALIVRMGEIAARELRAVELRPSLRADMVLPFSDLHPTILKDIESLQPTGEGNPEAVFVTRNVTPVSPKVIGTEKKHLRMKVTDGRITYDAVAFNQSAWAEKMPSKIDILYKYEKNSYMGRETLQLNIRDIQPSS